MSDEFEDARHAAAEMLHREIMDDMPGWEGNATFIANKMIAAFLAKLRETHVVMTEEDLRDVRTQAVYDAQVDF